MTDGAIGDYIAISLWIAMIVALPIGMAGVVFLIVRGPR